MPVIFFVLLVSESAIPYICDKGSNSFSTYFILHNRHKVVTRPP